MSASAAPPAVRPTEYGSRGGSAVPTASFAPVRSLVQRFRFSPDAILRGDALEYGDGCQPWLRIGLREFEGRIGFAVAERVGGRWGPARMLWPNRTGMTETEVTVRFAEDLVWLSAGTAPPSSLRTALMRPADLNLRHPPTIGLATAVGPQHVAPQDPLRTADTGAQVADGFDGWLEVGGRLPGTGSCLLLGWVRDRALETVRGAVTVSLGASAEPGSTTLIVFHDRADLHGEGIGVLALAAESVGALAWSQGVTLRIGDRPSLHLAAAPSFQQHDTRTRVAIAKRILATARGVDRPSMETLLARAFSGTDTLDGLSAPVWLDVFGILPSSCGVLLRGLLADPSDAVVAIRVATEAGVSEPLQRRWLPAEPRRLRGAAACPAPPSACGFVACAEVSEAGRAGAWLEVELSNGEIGCKPLSATAATGLDAIVEVLDEVRIPVGGLRHAFDEVLGPPLLAHGQALASRSVAVEVATFGVVPPAPRASVVVPLYRRVDFMAWQLALFSAGGVAGDEILYVLDDPTLRDAALNLAESAHARFGLPFRLLLPSERRGFGPASNLGLEHARGEFVCLLNSDVFPLDTHWLDRLLEALARDPSVGAAGAHLVFADGSTQHAGMRYEAIPAMGNWLFPIHPGKGLRPTFEVDAIPVPAVTGACMALRRRLAAELGGFCTDFVIGDFEDADLCERLRTRGLTCVVVPGATLVHLERQSQGDSAEAWRRNLTLLNAWIFARRWGDEPALRGGR